MPKSIKFKNDLYLNGTIIESGTNSNGSYFKYDNGLLFQYGQIPKEKFLNGTTYSNAVQGITLYRSNDPDILLPTTFKDTNYTVTTGYQCIPGDIRAYFVRHVIINASIIKLQLSAFEDFTSSGNAYKRLISVAWQAVGKWK